MGRWYKLSVSFRLGPELAAVANRILRTYTFEATPIIGCAACAAGAGLHVAVACLVGPHLASSTRQRAWIMSMPQRACIRSVVSVLLLANSAAPVECIDAADLRTC